MPPAPTARTERPAPPTAGRRRRWTALRVGLVTALMAGLTVLAPSAQACACGGVVDRQGSDTTVNGETAVVSWNGTREVVTIRLDASSNATDAGLLIPTPTPAKAALGDPTMFDDLAAASLPRQEVREHWIGPPAIFGGGNDNGGGDGAAPGAGSGVDVLSVTDLGPLEATVLKADDPKALKKWLDKRDFQMGTAFAALVKPYTRDGWSFVAIRLTTEGQALQGELPPIQLSFASDEAVYPMRMSRGALVGQQTRTYVLAEHRMQRTDASSDSATTVFAGPLTADQVTSPALAKALRGTPYVTTIDQYFAKPAQEVRSDFVFEQSVDDDPFQQVVYTDTYRIPIDLGILGLAVAVLLLGGLMAVIRTRRTPTLESRRA